MKITEGPVTKIPGTNIETRWVLVTPDVAKLYMVANVENRMLRPKHLNRIAGDMINDRFHTTHHGIAFDENGKLIDGQHRLQSIITSGVGQWLLVTTGLSPVAQLVIDTGAKRAAHDLMPGKFTAVRSAAIRLYLAIDYAGGEFTSNSLAFTLQQITNASIQEAWNDFDNIEEYAGLAAEAARNVATCGPAALLLGAMCYPDTAKEFLTGLKNMSGLEVGDPRLALLKFRGGARRIQTSVAATVAVKAAKALNKGKPITIMRYTPLEKIKV